MKTEYKPYVDALIELAIREDIGDGDHTSLCCIPAALIGARAYYVLFSLDAYASGPWWKVFAIWEGGMAIYGGILAGIGYGFGSMIPATILINRWFHRKKGLAIGLCSASTGLAMIVFSPILTAICETRRLQACFLVEAVFSLVCAVLVFLLIRESPEKLSLSAYGAEDG